MCVSKQRDSLLKIPESEQGIKNESKGESVEGKRRWREARGKRKSSRTIGLSLPGTTPDDECYYYLYI